MPLRGTCCLPGSFYVSHLNPTMQSRQSRTTVAHMLRDFAMRKRFSLCVILCLVAYCNTAFSFETHCQDKTQIIFNCRIANTKKVVSVCALKPEGQDEQYLQYVFGELGKAELIFPKTDHIKNGQFTYSRQYSRFAGWRQYDLTFTIGPNRYNVYWMASSKTDGVPKENVEILSGVNVLTIGGKSIDLRCNEKNVVENFDDANVGNVIEVDQ